MIKRSLIRHYVTNMFTDTVDVGGRVFAARPNSPLFLDELPALNIHFGEAMLSVGVGDTHFVKEYEVTMDMVCTVVVENRVTSSTPVLSQAGMDYADKLGDEVVSSLNHDGRLARRLPDFDANSNYFGLIDGHALKSVLTYDVESDAGVAVIAQSLRFEIPYTEKASPNYRLESFEGFSGAITRVGVTNETVDPVLLEILGDLND